MGSRSRVATSYEATSQSGDFYLYSSGALGVYSKCQRKKPRFCGAPSSENKLLRNHLKKILLLIRPQDKIKIAVKLVPRPFSVKSYVHTRYFCLIECPGTTDMDCEEFALLGVDIVESPPTLPSPPPVLPLADETVSVRATRRCIPTNKEQATNNVTKLHFRKASSSSKALTKRRVVSCGGTTGERHRTHKFVAAHRAVEEMRVSVGLVEPVWQDMTVMLDGEGGFKVSSGIRRELVFKPVSIPALWSAVQQVNKAGEHARIHEHHSAGLSHAWLNYYTALHLRAVHTNRARVAEWVRLEGVEKPREEVLPQHLDNPTERQSMELEIARHLRHLMYSASDLDSLTVAQLRNDCESHFGRSLSEFRQFISKEALVILERMNEASRICPHLYLGSTYNASNLEELLQRNVTHILNVSREVDNFFADMERFHYKNVRVLDEESVSLLMEWQDTHAFINQAKKQNSCCLVHCKRGISRSAATVIAYLMKEYEWSLDEAMQHTKNCRSCVDPNPGFMRDLRIYEGMLHASANRFGQYESTATATSVVPPREDLEQDIFQYISSQIPMEPIPSECHDTDPSTLQLPPAPASSVLTPSQRSGPNVSQRSPLSELQHRNTSEVSDKSNHDTREERHLPGLQPVASNAQRPYYEMHMRRGEVAEMVDQRWGDFLNTSGVAQSTTAGGLRRCATEVTIFLARGRQAVSPSPEKSTKENRTTLNQSCSASSRQSTASLPSLLLSTREKQESDQDEEEPVDPEELHIPNTYARENIPWRLGSVIVLASEFDVPVAASTNRRMSSEVSPIISTDRRRVRTCSDSRQDFPAPAPESSPNTDAPPIRMVTSSTLLQLRPYPSLTPSQETSQPPPAGIPRVHQLTSRPNTLTTGTHPYREPLIDAEPIPPVRELVSRWSTNHTAALAGRPQDEQCL